MKKRVLIVGPSITETKGGMATVIKNMLDDRMLNTKYEISYVISHTEKSAVHKILYTLKTIKYLILNKNNYDIMHIHCASGASIYRKGIFVYIGKVFRKKIIIHVHGADFDDFYNNSNKLAKNIIRNIFRNCHKIILLSRSWLNYFSENITDKNLIVLNNGVFTNEYNDYICKDSSFNKFLFLGRLGYRKGTYDIIKALNVIVNKHNIKDIKVLFAGDGEVEKVKKLAEKLNLNKNVEILGWIDSTDKKKYFKESDFILLPSYDEGLPMALIEGMAAGKILISTYVGGIPDLIKNEKNGFLISAGDIESLTNIMEYVIDSNNKSKMEAIKNNNIKKAKKIYDLSIIHRKLDRLYRGR